MIDKIVTFLKKPFFTNPKTLFGLWMIVALAAGLWVAGKGNNFLIFRGVFWHTINQTSLYVSYPEEYFDLNHYGVLFSLIIAPFAVLPVRLGRLLWEVAMTLVLYKSVKMLPLEQKKRMFIYWFCAHELLTALFMDQFNVVIAAILIFSFIFIERGKDEWATLAIVVGSFVKLYGIVGLAFFFFSKHKTKFILTFIGWSVVCFVLPMAISSPSYVAGQYMEWFTTLVEKNMTNSDLANTHQNVSLLGMVHKCSGHWFSDLYLIVPGLVLFALPYLRFRQYGNIAFRYAFLSSVLLFVVLFSTGSESSSYIIALSGVALWYWTAPWKRNKWDIALMIFAFILTSLSPSDLFPKYLRVHFVWPYALKALPCVVIWFKLIWEMCFRDYSPVPEAETPSVASAR